VVAAAVSCGVLAVFALVTLRALRLLGDRIFDYQVYVSMAAAAAYLAVSGADVDAYLISLATLRFVILLWDVLDLLTLRLTRR
jgi:hypothetical protein